MARKSERDWESLSRLFTIKSGGRKGPRVGIVLIRFLVGIVLIQFLVGLVDFVPD